MAIDGNVPNPMLSLEAQNVANNNSNENGNNNSNNSVSNHIVRHVVTPIVPTVDDLLIIWGFIAAFATTARFAQGDNVTTHAMIGKTHRFTKHIIFLIF